MVFMIMSAADYEAQLCRAELAGEHQRQFELSRDFLESEHEHKRDAVKLAYQTIEAAFDQGVEEAGRYIAALKKPPPYSKFSHLPDKLWSDVCGVLIKPADKRDYLEALRVCERSKPLMQNSQERNDALSFLCRYYCLIQNQPYGQFLEQRIFFKKLAKEELVKQLTNAYFLSWANVYQVLSSKTLGAISAVFAACAAIYEDKKTGFVITSAVFASFAFVWYYWLSTFEVFAKAQKEYIKTFHEDNLDRAAHYISLYCVMKNLPINQSDVRSAVQTFFDEKSDTIEYHFIDIMEKQNEQNKGG